MFAHPIHQRVPADVQERGRPRDIPFSVIQGLLNDLSLNLLERESPRRESDLDRLRLGCLDGDSPARLPSPGTPVNGQIRRADRRPVRQQHGPFDHVFQFPDVPRPGIDP